MKNSWDFSDGFDSKFAGLIAEDRREIDGRDNHDRMRVMFYHRMKVTFGLIEKYFPDSSGVRVGDFGCAQANFGLLLAERGYEVFAVDMSSLSLEYAKLKYETGKVHWINSRFSDVELAPNLLDVGIMAEVITTFAYPERVVAKVMESIRPGGLLIATFPNGASLRNRLMTYKDAIRKKYLEKLQPQEDGIDHLYKLPPEQLNYIVPAGARIVEKGFCGSTWLLNKFTQPFSRLIPASWIASWVDVLTRVPLISRATCYLQFVVLRRDSSESTTPRPRTANLSRSPDFRDTTA